MYNIFLKIEDVALQLPINPEEIKFKYETSINRYDIVGLGEISEVNADKLIETSISSFIPRINTNLITNSDIIAQRFFEKIDEARKTGQVIELVINRDSLEDIAMDCLIGVFNIIEKAGEVDDVYYELSLVQYREHEPIKLDIQKPAPLPLIIPVNQTFSQTSSNDNSIPVRREGTAKASANVSIGLSKGDAVICNNKGYAFKSGFLGLGLKVNNQEGKILNIYKGEKYPYQVSMVVVDKNGNKQGYSYHFQKEDLTLVKKSTG